jgi:hypothetical protein
LLTIPMAAMPGVFSTVSGRLRARQPRRVGAGRRLRAGLACGGTLTLASGCCGMRVQRRRSIMTTSTMITITTMVPMPINMGVLSDAHRPRGTERVPGWPGAGRAGGLSRAVLGSGGNFWVAFLGLGGETFHRILGAGWLFQRCFRGLFHRLLQYS